MNHPTTPFLVNPDQIVHIDFYQLFMTRMEVEEVINLNTKQLVGWVLVVGAVNWGLVGLLNLNVVEAVLGAGSLLTKVVYLLVGLAGVYKAYLMVSGGKK